MDKLHRVALDGAEIEYETHGAGEHVVLVHHGVGIDAEQPTQLANGLSSSSSAIHQV